MQIWGFVKLIFVEGFCDDLQVVFLVGIRMLLYWESYTHMCVYSVAESKILRYNWCVFDASVTLDSSFSSKKPLLY